MCPEGGSQGSCGAASYFIEMTGRKHWAALFKDYSDERLREFLANATKLEREATDTLGRTVHRDRRLAAARELRRRGLGA